MRAIILLALLGLAAFGQLVSARQSSLGAWTQFKRQHGKVYADQAEDARRFSLFLAARDRIERHNANASHSYKLGLSHLSDWTPEERAKLNGFRGQHESSLKQSDDSILRSILDDPAPIPDEVDWRKVANRVAPIKNQGQCGSCWAFATTGVLEGQQVVRNFTSELIPLSERELVDCSIRNGGCDGGWMAEALADVALAGGIESEQSYPYYDDSLLWCRLDDSKVVMTDSGFVTLPLSDETALKKVVAKFGPVATTMDAGGSFQDYKSGIFSDPDCGQEVDHAVLVVGYGTDPKHGDFWIVKNSWSEQWGEKGFFRIKRGVSMCAIGHTSNIPTFSKVVIGTEAVSAQL